jgi:BirA family biotin operon repressor/biotin-[acetyl-CoA-carboxylase] ligase
MASLAVHDALRVSCELETDIKWPNDLLVNERKLCGILAETVETRLGRAVIIGIGINLTADALPVALRDRATSVQTETNNSVELKAVLQALVNALERRYEMLQSAGGRDEIIREWCARSSYASGKRIRIANGEEILAGTTRGLESNGALRVETDAGEIKSVSAGDVTILGTSV